MIFRVLFLWGMAASLLGSANVQAADDEAIAFNETIAAANKKLRDAGFEYGKVVSPAFNLKAVDATKLKKEHDSVKQALAEVLQSTSKAKIPDSDEARSLKKAHDRFLDGQKEMVESDLAAIQKIMEDAALDANAKKLKLTGVLESMEQREKKAHEDLAAAQIAFAKKHGLKLVPEGK